MSDSTNLVDPASSHMLVSKIKPCKSKYKLIYTAKLRIAHYNGYNLHDDHYHMDIHGNSGANTCYNTRLFGRVAFISCYRPNHLRVLLVIIMTERIAFMRQFVRVSDLSAPVGRVLAYRGCDG